MGINLVKSETEHCIDYSVHKYGWVDERITGRRTEMRKLIWKMVIIIVMDYQTKENLRKLFIQVKDELVDEKMGIYIECSKVGSEMLGDVVEWSDDVAKLEEKPFGIIIGNIKDTDIPVALSAAATVNEFHIAVRIYHKNEGIPFKHLKFGEGLFNEQATDKETVKETDFRCPPIV